MNHRHPLAAAASILLLCASAFAADVVIPLKADNAIAKGRDTRTWRVPVSVAGVDSEFIWGCGGWTVVSQSFAEKAQLKVRDDADTAGFTTGDGKPIFMGSADAEIRFAGRLFKENVKVMRQQFADRGMTGVLGYNVGAKVQWEINPDPAKPTMTVRDLGSKPSAPAIATLKLRDDDENLWLKVKVRGSEVDVALMPQSTDIQAGPTLQRKWDLASGKPEESSSFLGRVRTHIFTDMKDCLELSPQFKETNLLVILVGDPKDEDPNTTQRSGLGASLLNRYTYCVDAREGQFMILARSKPVPAAGKAAGGATTQPTR